MAHNNKSKVLFCIIYVQVDNVFYFIWSAHTRDALKNAILHFESFSQTKAFPYSTTMTHTKSHEGLALGNRP